MWGDLASVAAVIPSGNACASLVAVHSDVAGAPAPAASASESVWGDLASIAAPVGDVSVCGVDFMGDIGAVAAPVHGISEDRIANDPLQIWSDLVAVAAPVAQPAAIVTDDVGLPSAPALVVKRPRGRPRKAEVAKVEHAVVMTDTDTQTDPSPGSEDFTETCLIPAVRPAERQDIVRYTKLATPCRSSDGTAIVAPLRLGGLMSPNPLATQFSKAIALGASEHTRRDEDTYDYVIDALALGTLPLVSKRVALQFLPFDHKKLRQVQTLTFVGLCIDQETVETELTQTIVNALPADELLAFHEVCHYDESSMTTRTHWCIA